MKQPALVKARIVDAKTLATSSCSRRSLWQIAGTAAATSAVLLAAAGPAEAKPTKQSKLAPIPVKQAEKFVPAKIAWATRKSVLVAALDGSGRRKLATLPKGFQTNQLSLSPDGSRLLISNRDASWLVDTNTTSLVALRQGKKSVDIDEDPVSWAPDSSKFSVIWSDFLNCAVADGKCGKTAVNGIENEYGASWSRDSSKQAVVEYVPRYSKKRPGKVIGEQQVIKEIAGAEVSDLATQPKRDGETSTFLSPPVATPSGWVWGRFHYHGSNKGEVEVFQRQAGGPATSIYSKHFKFKKNGEVAKGSRFFMPTGIAGDGQLVGYSGFRSQNQTRVQIVKLVGGAEVPVTASYLLDPRTGYRKRDFMGLLDDNRAVVIDSRYGSNAVKDRTLRLLDAKGLGAPIAKGVNVAVAVPFPNNTILF